MVVVIRKLSLTALALCAALIAALPATATPSASTSLQMCTFSESGVVMALAGRQATSSMCNTFQRVISWPRTSNSVRVHDPRCMWMTPDGKTYLTIAGTYNVNSLILRASCNIVAASMRGAGWTRVL